MKAFTRYSLRILFIAAAIVLTGMTVDAQTEPVYGSSVPVRAWISTDLANQDPFDSVPWQMQMNAAFEPSYPGAGDGIVSRTNQQADQNSDPVATVKHDLGTQRVCLYKTYYVDVSASWLLSSKFSITAPPGYQVTISGTDGQNGSTQIPGSSSTWFYTNTTQTIGSGLTIQFSVAPKLPSVAAPVGQASSFGLGKFEWHVSLGTDHNGESAGELVLFDPADDPNWTGAELYNPLASLYYNSKAGCRPIIEQAWGGQDRADGLRSYLLGAHQGAFDIVIISPTTYEVLFYNQTQVVWEQGGGTHTGRYQFAGDPFVKYRVEKGAADGTLVITQETRNIDNTSFSGAVATRRTTSVSRSGTFPSIQWEVLDWASEGAATPAKHLSQSGGTAADRSYTNSTSYVGGQTAAESTESYHLGAWGEAVTARTVGGPSGTGVSYSYYTDPGVPMQYGRPQTKIFNDGRWESYVYASGYSGNSEDENRFYAGIVQQVNRPWQDSPTTPTNDPNLGECTQYFYAIDPFGYPSRPAGVIKSINGVTVERTHRGYSSGGRLGGKLDLVKVVRSEFASGPYNSSDGTAKALDTITHYFREDTEDEFFRNKIHSVANADGSKTSFVYQRGSWDGSTFTPQLTALAKQLYWGNSTRTIKINGMAAGGDTYTAFGEYDIDDISLVGGVATMETEIRDDNALLVKKEQHVWKDGQWHSISHTNYVYNPTHRLKQVIGSNGVITDYSYNGLDLESEVSSAGVKTSYTYDALGRAETKKLNAAGTIATLSTKYEYDAANRMTKELVGWGGAEQLVTTRTYNTAGQLLSEKTPGVNPTTHAYGIANRTHTITRPDGYSVIETRYLDGSIASVTGAGVVPSYRQESIDSAGLRTETTRLGSASSPRWKKVTKDWLNRVVKTEQPSVGGLTTIVEEHFYHGRTGANPGKLYKSTRTGTAPTRFEYDVTGDLLRTGSDFDDNGLALASHDRITEFRQLYVQDAAGSWWRESETWNYPFSGSNAKQRVSLERTRYSGFVASRISEVQTTDREGNSSTQTVDVDRGAAKVTRKIARTGLTQSDQVEVSVNGLLVSATTHDGLSTANTYDALHRLLKTTDSRNNTTTIGYYSGTGLVSSITDALERVVSTKGYDTSGRLYWSGDALNNYKYVSYTPHGALFREWGGGATPVEYGYDATYGDRTTMKTFRTGNSWSSTTWPTGEAADVTTWGFDPYTGILLTKTDAANKVVTFTYNQRGQLLTVTRPRGDNANLVTTYGYFDLTGELHTLSYSDGTPGVSYGDAPQGAVSSYTRLGLPVSVTDATGTRDFIYDIDRPWRLATEALDTFYDSKVLTYLFDNSQVIGRGRGFQLGVDSNPASDLEQSTVFSTNGRVDKLTSKAGGGNTRVFTYGYIPSSALVRGFTVDNAAYSAVRSYEDDRNILSSTEYQWGATILTGYAYSSNGNGQRETAKQYGSAFNDYGASTYQRFWYDAQGRLTSAVGYLGEDPTQIDVAKQLPSRAHSYNYDPIGNRLSANHTGVSALANAYVSNALNQYTSRENNTLSFSGTATPSAKVAISGGAALADRQGSFWADEKVVNNINGPWTGDVSVYAATAQAVRTQTIAAQLPAAQQAFAYDHSGNLTSDGIWDYQYDAENRLKRMETMSSARAAGIAHRVLCFTYDYLGRRVAKRVLDGRSGVEIVSRRYLYVGWSLVAEFAAPDGTALGALQRSYTWGLDIAGSFSATGGVGALLQVADHPSGKRYFAAYDGNGNVAALVNAATGALAAVYEYDPYGNSLRNETIDSTLNGQPYRFSTKYQDFETGLYNYGYRFYSPSLGRFINRDPIEESGGINLYAFCSNDAINRFDVLGNSADSVVVLDEFAVNANRVQDFGWSGPLTRITGAVSSVRLFGFVPEFARIGFPPTYQPDAQSVANYQNQKKTGVSDRTPGSENHPAAQASAEETEAAKKALREGKAILVYDHRDGQLKIARLKKKTLNGGGDQMNMGDGTHINRFRKPGSGWESDKLEDPGKNGEILKARERIGPFEDKATAIREANSTINTKSEEWNIEYETIVLVDKDKYYYVRPWTIGSFNRCWAPDPTESPAGTLYDIHSHRDFVAHSDYDMIHMNKVNRPSIVVWPGNTAIQMDPRPGEWPITTSFKYNWGTRFPYKHIN